MKTNGHIINTIKKMHIPYDSDISTVALYNAIFNHCKANGANPEKFHFELIDNFLFADGTLIDII